MTGPQPRAQGSEQGPDPARSARGQPDLCSAGEMAGQSQGGAGREVGPTGLGSVGRAWPLSRCTAGVGGGEPGPQEAVDVQGGRSDVPRPASCPGGPHRASLTLQGMPRASNCYLLHPGKDMGLSACEIISHGRPNKRCMLGPEKHRNVFSGSWRPDSKVKVSAAPCSLPSLSSSFPGGCLRAWASLVYGHSASACPFSSVFSLSPFIFGSEAQHDG